MCWVLAPAKLWLHWHIIYTQPSGWAARKIVTTDQSLSVIPVKWPTETGQYGPTNRPTFLKSISRASPAPEPELRPTSDMRTPDTGARDREQWQCRVHHNARFYVIAFSLLRLSRKAAGLPNDSQHNHDMVILLDVLNQNHVHLLLIVDSIISSVLELI